MIKTFYQFVKRWYDIKNENDMLVVDSSNQAPILGSLSRQLNDPMIGSNSWFNKTISDKPSKRRLQLRCSLVRGF